MKNILFIPQGFRLVGFIAMLMSSIISSAQPGTLDVTFGGVGYVITDISNSEEEPRASFLLPDGTIIVSGENNDGTQEDFMMIKYNSDGSLNLGFGINGVAVYDFSLTGSDDLARGFEVLPNSKIIACGRAYNSSSGYTDMMLVRLNANGLPDSTFGTNGVLKISMPSTDFYPSRLRTLSNGQFLVCGRINDFGSGDILLSKHNADGSLDSSFGSNGFVFLDVFGSFDQANAVAMLPGDESVVAGWAYNPSISNDQIILIKFKTNGAIDSSFGIDGQVHVPDFGAADQYRDILFSGTHIYASGHVTITSLDIIASRFHLDGQLDSTFGVNGHAVVDYAGDDDECEALSIQPDGKIVLSATPVTAGEEDFGAVRLTSDGSLDSTFGGDGWFVQDVTNHDDVFDLILQPDGKIVLVGITDDETPQQNVMVMRINGDNQSDVPELNGDDEFSIHPNPASQSLVIDHAPFNKGETELKIFDVMGREVFQSSILGSQFSVDVSTFESGIYFVRLSSPQVCGEAVSQKLVIQH